MRPVVGANSSLRKSLPTHRLASRFSASMFLYRTVAWGTPTAIWALKYSMSMDEGDCDIDSSSVSCGECSQPLPLRQSHGNAASLLWHCAACGHPADGRWDERAPAQLARNVRIADTHFQTGDAEPLPERLGVISDLLAQRAGDQHGVERRKSPRTPRRVRVTVCPLTAGFEPQGPPFGALVINASETGLGMLVVGGVSAPMLAIEMPLQRGKTGQMIARVVRSNQLTTSIHVIGLDLVHRLGHLPPAERGEANLNLESANGSS